MSEPPSPITSRDELRCYLWEACEIEQQLMIQYLFAAFTLKKHPDRTCTPAQWEFVRRWGSQVMMVARQEMEHLALANGILTAIGEDPFFGRENIGEGGVQSRYFLGRERARDHSPSAAREGSKRRKEPIPCDIPFLFHRFDLDTVGRFVCAEAPSYDQLEKEGARIAHWCFGTPKHPCRPTSLADWEADGRLRAAAAGEAGARRLARTHLPAPGLPAAAGKRAARQLSEPLHPGSIQELYDRIRRALHRLPNLFVGNPAQQVFVPVEYQINVTAVTDVASADLAIDLIVEEGEGIDAPPGFQSHYDRFFAVYDELREQLGDAFQPALPVVTNPTADVISQPYTLRVFHLFNHAYATLLFVLTSLYRNFNANDTSYPFLSTALQNMAFGPFMTMVLRPLAEVLVYLRTEDRGARTAGPNFYLTPADELLIWPRAPQPVRLPGELVPGQQASQAPALARIDFFLDRMAHLVGELAALSTDRGLKKPLLDAAHEEWARRQLAFVHQNATAMANNLRRVYQVGEIPQFALG